MEIRGAVGAACEEARNGRKWPYGLCVSNIRFLDGEARVTVQRMNGAGLVDGRIVFGYRSEAHEYFTVGLHSEGKAYQIVHFDPAIGWYPLAPGWLGGQIWPIGRAQLPLRVRWFSGQRVSLEVDGVSDPWSMFCRCRCRTDSSVCTRGCAKAAVYEFTGLFRTSRPRGAALLS